MHNSMHGPDGMHGNAMMYKMDSGMQGGSHGGHHRGSLSWFIKPVIFKCREEYHRLCFTQLSSPDVAVSSPPTTSPARATPDGGEAILTCLATAGTGDAIGLSAGCADAVSNATEAIASLRASCAADAAAACPSAGVSGLMALQSCLLTSLQSLSSTCLTRVSALFSASIAAATSAAADDSWGWRAPNMPADGGAFDSAAGLQHFPYAASEAPAWGNFRHPGGASPKEAGSSWAAAAAGAASATAAMAAVALGVVLVNRRRAAAAAGTRSAVVVPRADIRWFTPSATVAGVAAEPPLLAADELAQRV